MGADPEQISVLRLFFTLFVAFLITTSLISLFILVRRHGTSYVVRGFLSPLFDVISNVVGVGDAPSASSRSRYLETLIERLEEQSANTASLSSQTESKILSLFEEAIGKGFDQQIKISLKSLISRDVNEELKNRSLRPLIEIQERLQQASKTASIRGFFNLSIGIGFAVAALFILRAAVDLFSAAELLQISLSQTIYAMGIRISLALVITLIAYFFLALYKKSLDDVKFYQNEITTIGLATASVYLSYDCKTDDARIAVAQLLLRRENGSAPPTQVADSEGGFVNRLIDKLIDRIPVT